MCSLALEAAAPAEQLGVVSYVVVPQKSPAIGPTASLGSSSAWTFAKPSRIAALNSMGISGS